MTFDEYIDGEVDKTLRGWRKTAHDTAHYTASAAAGCAAMEALLRHAVESGQITLPNKE